MATGAIHPQTGLGILVSIDGTELGEVTNMPQVAGGQSEDIEVTHFRSPAREYLAGLADNGEVQLTVNLNPADEGQRIAYKAREDGTTHTITVELPYATPMTLTFEATVRSFQVTASVGSGVSADITLRVSGAITGFPAPTV